MIVNAVVTGIIVFATGYLLGSIPSAYIVTRLFIGKDVRRLGGGNVGGLNTYREVGLGPALVVVIVDFGKGVAVVAIVYWLLDLSLAFVLLGGLAAVIAHNWSVWLKFSGGKGMATTIGALLVVMPLYGYWLGLVILLSVIGITLLITRNVALSNGTGLVALPFIIWLGTHSGTAIIFSVVLGLLIGLKSLAGFRDALARSSSVSDFIFDRWQRGQR